MVLLATTFAFPQSAFVPVIVGFFGLGTGYFIWGGQALSDYPASDAKVDQTMGMWGFWMPGFMQFITGVYLLVGMTWFQVFTSTPPLFMAGLAFTAFGIHWFAMAHRRFIGSSDLPDAWMAIAFFLVSVLGVVVFIGAKDIPVAIVFIGLSLIYLTKAPTRFGRLANGGRLVAIWQLLTGVWLMYMTWAVTLNATLGAHWWV